jgi:FtsP/CotA-like multicopper oxidase with cupredoxin domain
MLNQDCFNQSYSSLTINGGFPGPTLHAVTGDAVEITVKNDTPDSPISIHFHGIRQVGTPFADGVANITQLAIPPGQSFVHKFTIVEQSGTFYYHAHVAFHDDTVQGPFIIFESEDSLNKVAKGDPHSLHKRHKGADTEDDTDEEDGDDDDDAKEDNNKEEEDKTNGEGKYDNDEADKDKGNNDQGDKADDQEEADQKDDDQKDADKGSDTRIKEGPYTYDGEIILQWSEWWHQTNEDRYTFAMGPIFTAPTAPDAFLLNGKSVFSNDSAVQASQNGSDSCKGFEIFNVESNKTYRLRFIGALTLRILGVLIPEHQMTLIEIDGEYTQPYNLSYVEFGPGQRMSVLIHTGDYPDGTIFPIASNNRRIAVGIPGYTVNGYGYLKYGKSQDKKILTAPGIATLPQDVFPAVDAPGWILKDVKPYNNSEEHVLNAKPYQTIKITMDEVFIGNLTRFSGNGRVWRPWGTPTMSVLDTVLANPINIASLESDGYSNDHNTYYLPYGKVVDLVFQNGPTTGGVCVVHPWHTHGHSHYLIAEGYGSYDMQKDANATTFAHPLKKDVSMVYPMSVNNTLDCGWTKVRIFTVSFFFFFFSH